MGRKRPCGCRHAARDALPGLRRIHDTRSREDVRGVGHDDEGVFVTYHVTDRPEDLVRMLRRVRAGSGLVKAYGEKGRSAELGPGLYVSGNPDYWVNRATGKWSFLKDLDEPAVRRLTRAIREDVRRASLSEGERERLERDLRYVEQGLMGPEGLVGFAGPPYSVAFWRPEFLEPLGIRAGRRPGVVEVRLRGRFAELDGSYPSAALLRTLRRMRLQGAFTRAGISTNPELVVWDPRAIVGARIASSDRDGRDGRDRTRKPQRRRAWRAGRV